jgi:hypothetical protein
MDITEAEQNDHYKNLNWVNDKMMFKPQNMILNTEDYDYMDSFTPYIYKADIKNRTYINSPTWNSQYYFYLDEYNKYMLYSYLYTVGGREFKKFIKPLLQDYFPDKSIQNIYNAARQYICRNNMKKLTEMEQIYFKCEFTKLMMEYGKVWNKKKQLEAKANCQPDAEEQDSNESITSHSSQICDINVKEKEKNNLKDKDNNILYNKASFTPMSQFALSDKLSFDGVQNDASIQQIQLTREQIEDLEQIEKDLEELAKYPNYTIFDYM